MTPISAQKMYLRQLLMLTLGLVNFQDELSMKVDYYTRLLTQNAIVANLSLYRPRTSNGDFLDGADFKSIKDFGTYDFIVIGAGSAGSVVANRLSEIEKWKVLVLEAGLEYDDLPSIPGAFPYSMQSPRDWGYFSVPQKYGFLGMNNNSFPYARGKIVGGTGALNALIYARGNRADYDLWGSLGNPGWSYDELLPYFRKAENMHFEGESSYHGFDGPMTVEYTPVVTPMLNDIIEANKEMGLEYLDYNGHTQIGVSRMESNIKFGRRECGASTFIELAKARRNLKILTQAFVTKLHIEHETVTGVRFVHRNKVYDVRAKLEVVLSAGSINTAQILMLSGVGPAHDLKKLGIHTKVDLPVGKILKDHPGVMTLLVRTNYTEKTQTTREQVEEFMFGRGWLTTPFSASAISFINTRGDSPTPDIELIFVPPHSPGANLPVNFRQSTIEDSQNKIVETTDIQIIPILLHPIFSGTVKLASNSPRDFPLIDFHLYEYDEDIEVIYRAIRFIEEWTHTPALARHNATLIPPDLRNCRHWELNTREHWYCVVRTISIIFYHASTTVKMGPPDDPWACVNHELKLYGLTKLRIADVSVNPVTISGHTNAIAFAVGEKAADLIKQEYLKY